MFGGQNSYLQQGQWDFSVSYLRWYSHKHYVGTHPNSSINPYGPFNTRNQFNFRLQYGLTSRWFLSLDVPFQHQTYNGLWPVAGYSTTRVPVKTGATGIGDITVRAGYWLFNTEQATGNLSVSLGLQMPTGNSDATSNVYGRTIPVEWSVQPGDGAWGLAPTIQGFHSLWKGMSVYGVATYLIDPRNTTGTPWFFPDLFYGDTSVVNSSTDQYFAEAGVSFPSPIRWVTPTLGYIVSGVPRRDLIGKSDGFRRPATLGYVAPGFDLTAFGQTFNFSFPVVAHINVKPPIHPTQVGSRTLYFTDATVPGFMFSFNYNIRFR